MKINLEIRDDEELRKVVKDMVIGAAKSVAREEIQKAVNDEVERLLDSQTLREISKNAIKSIVGGWGSDRGIREIVTKEVQPILEDRVTKLVNVKLVEDAIQKAAKDAVTQAISLQQTFGGATDGD